MTKAGRIAAALTIVAGTYAGTALALGARQENARPVRMAFADAPDKAPAVGPAQTPQQAEPQPRPIRVVLPAPWEPAGGQSAGTPATR